MPATTMLRCVVRFQNTPSTSAGNRLDAASENATLTRNRILPTLSNATYDASSVTPSNKIFEMITRR